MNNKLLIISMLGGALTSLAGNEPTITLQVKQGTIDLLHSLRASRSNPDHARRNITPRTESLLLEDGLGQKFPIEKVPQWMKDEMEKKVRKVFRPEWLQGSIQDSLIAIKDAKVNEITSRAQNTATFIEYGDFLVLDYNRRGHRITVIESGTRHLLVRILLPDERDPRGTGPADLIDILSRYLEMPENAMNHGDISIDEIDGMNIYKRMNGPTGQEAMEAAIRGEKREWWAELRVFFDGQMILLTVPDLPDKGGELRFSPRMTLPDRF